MTSSLPLPSASRFRPPKQPRLYSASPRCPPQFSRQSLAHRASPRPLPGVGGPPSSKAREPKRPPLPVGPILLLRVGFVTATVDRDRGGHEFVV